MKTKNNSEKPNFPCSICNSQVRGNSKAVCCDVCDQWVHISCNSISSKLYEKLMEPDNNDTFICNKCILPFCSQTDEESVQTNVLGLNNKSNVKNFGFKLNKNEKKSINHISNLILENNDPGNENSNFCNYYTVDEFVSKKFDNTNNFSIFHLNTHSLQYHKNDLDILLDSLKLEFDIIAISETKLQKGIAPVHDISIPNYQYDQID